MNNNVHEYKKLDDIDHCLLLPGRYIGAVAAKLEEMYLYDDETKKFGFYEVSYSPGLMKIFDEIITNSVDEHKKNPKLNKIEVTVDIKNKSISVYDNGGIIVVKHPEYGEWIPTFIFSNLKSGTNFHKNKKDTGGLHGEGSTLTNIFSTKFIVETCDGKNSFYQEFTDNMRNISDPIIKPAKTTGYTKITFYPDIKQFPGITFDNVVYDLIRKRVIDISACNQSISFSINKSNIKFNSFKDYCKLYRDEIFYESSQDWRIAVGLSNSGFKQVSFVNSVETKDGGTHVEYILDQIIKGLREKIKKKYKVDLKPSDLKQYMFLFIDCKVYNVMFSSQTKEKLIKPASEFGTEHEISEKLIKQIFESDIVKNILDWLESKKAAEEKRELRKLNTTSSINSVENLIDAKDKLDRKKCILSIYEGDSAATAFRRYRDSSTMGAYTLGGKFINVWGMKPLEIMNSVKAKNLLSALGLKINEHNAFVPYPDSQQIKLKIGSTELFIDVNDLIYVEGQWLSYKELAGKKIDPNNLLKRRKLKECSIRYGSIYLYTDADTDGDSISAQVINLLATYWPELFELGIVYKVMTPLVVAKNKTKIIPFYSMEDYNKWYEDSYTSDFNIEYKKGLAALEDKEYEDIIKKPVLVKITKDDLYMNNLLSWFNDNADGRKSLILKYQ